MLREFTIHELRRYNGKDGSPPFVACEGKVYDLSESFLWRGGRHQVLHSAGADLTTALIQAPHNADLLARFPVVGILVSGKPQPLDDSGLGV